MKEFVVLVNEKDEELGLMEKQQAHVAGLLHRAFSVFVFNSKGELLLQQRAEEKYHSPLLWTNTCCSHPREGETYEQAAHRRLVEEMGFDCELEEKFHFIYKAKLGEKLFEHELDHVFTGFYEGEIKINRDEVKDYKWISMDELISDMNSNPEKYTIWFRIIFDEYLAKLEYAGND
ncbi:MAG TPA: isopentenyl-diphosphate Delta-isomerase [Moheibacter sp.]|nr:isopentenyl-diphosphate Delta-isomerase [Moheibacter sp.]